jgi:hypothetical protein
MEITTAEAVLEAQQILEVVEVQREATTLTVLMEVLV